MSSRPLAAALAVWLAAPVGHSDAAGTKRREVAAVVESVDVGNATLSWHALTSTELVTTPAIEKAAAKLDRLKTGKKVKLVLVDRVDGPAVQEIKGPGHSVGFWLGIVLVTAAIVLSALYVAYISTADANPQS